VELQKRIEHINSRRALLAIWSFQG